MRKRGRVSEEAEAEEEKLRTTNDPRDERYDERRFNQDGDDQAGRQWSGMKSDFEDRGDKD